MSLLTFSFNDTCKSNDRNLNKYTNIAIHVIDIADRGMHDHIVYLYHYIIGIGKILYVFLYNRYIIIHTLHNLSKEIGLYIKI